MRDTVTVQTHSTEGKTHAAAQCVAELTSCHYYNQDNKDLYLPLQGSEHLCFARKQNKMSLNPDQNKDLCILSFSGYWPTIFAPN